MLVVLLGCGQSATQRAESALTVAAYERELDACKEKGKAAKSYAVYETCAAEVDARLCRERGLRCPDGGAR